MVLLVMALLSCTPPREDPVAVPCDSGGETGRDTGENEQLDVDGDGWLSPSAEVPAAEADCDDSDPTVTPETVRWIPPGAFLQGDPELDFASPQREVELSGYCMQVLEVTNRDYVDFLQRHDGIDHQRIDGVVYDADGERLYDLTDANGDDDVPERIVWEDAGYTVVEGYEQHPVAEVTWHGAQAYCQDLGGGLPTEAQWEKAARGGCELRGDPARCEPDDAPPWPWGWAEPSCELMNHGVELGDDGAGCSGATVEVGSYPAGASPYGMLDIAGNLLEWVHDHFLAEYYADAPTVDPEGPDYGWIFDPFCSGDDARGLRGGGWRTGPSMAMVSARAADWPHHESNTIGFRCSFDAR